MNRLTFDGNFCDIAQCQEVTCKYPDTGCSQRQVWERLKAIEDILGDDYELEELRQAMGERSLIGKPVYGIRRRGVSKHNHRIHDAWVVNRATITSCPGNCYVREKVCVQSDLARLGTTVFLSREEAEAAIGGTKK